MAMTGGCLCGAVRYEATAEPVFQGNCYCMDCQKESGGGHSTGLAVPTAGLKVSGATTTFTKNGDSGSAVERDFCPRCGATLFSRPHVMAGLTMIHAGTLDDPALAAPQMNVYVSRAQAWDQPPTGIPSFPELPPMG